jgi:hypothetical protein
MLTMAPPPFFARMGSKGTAEQERPKVVGFHF